MIELSDVYLIGVFFIACTAGVLMIYNKYYHDRKRKKLTKKTHEKIVTEFYEKLEKDDTQ